MIFDDLVESFPVSIQQPKAEKKLKTDSLASENAGISSAPETKAESDSKPESDPAAYLNKLEVVPP